jgi:hypothetical protein
MTRRRDRAGVHVAENGGGHPANEDRRDTRAHDDPAVDGLVADSRRGWHPGLS